MQQHDRLALIALITQRMADLKQALAHTRSLSDKKQTQSDDNDASLDITINTTVDTQITAEQQSELAQLQHSLLWLASDEAGECIDCGNDIPIERIKAIPSTQRCVHCAQHQQ